MYHHADPARLTLRALFRHGIAKAHTHLRLADPLPADTSIRAEALLLARAAWQGLRGDGENLRIGVVNAGLLRGLRTAARAAHPSAGDRRRGPGS